MKNLILIGMMGSGKTTVGRILSRRLGRALVDTDEMIESRAGRPIPDIFATQGEGYFRAMELEACRELRVGEGLVISCGGGLPLQAECMRLLRQGGVTFWLDRDPGQTYDALDVSARPLAQGGREEFLERYARRAPVYRSGADHVIHRPPSAEAAADAILEILKREGEPE